MPAFDLHDLPSEVVVFLTERHLATLTVMAPDGSPRVTPVGFTYDPESKTARVITWADSWKAKHVSAGQGTRVAICSMDGGRWLTLYGSARVSDEDGPVAEGVRRYAERYRPPKTRDDRVVIEVAVDRLVGRA